MLRLTYKNIHLTIEITHYQPYVRGRTSGPAELCCEDIQEEIEWRIVDTQAPALPTPEDRSTLVMFSEGLLTIRERQEIEALISKELTQQRASSGHRRHRNPSDSRRYWL